MGRMTEEPRVGDSVHLQDGLVGKNGVIVAFDYSDKEYTVDFYDHGYETIERDEFLGQLNERVNQWQIIR